MAPLPPPPPPRGGGLSSTGTGGATCLDRQPRPRQPLRIANPNRQADNTQMFEVVVPVGVVPGRPFALLAGGVRVLVTCPKDARPGQKIRFNLPVGLVNRPDGPKGKLAEIKLSYDKDGWARTIRATDMKFQWTRLNEIGIPVDERTRFEADQSAYVLKLDYLDDNDRLRRGACSLVTPERGVVDSKIKSTTGSDLVSYSDIATAQVKGYDDKIQWFQDTCAQLCEDWNKGHMRINVRREYLLGDSMEAVMSLSRKDLRKVWRFEFIGEAGIDAGGLAREWFELVTDEVFDPDMGLWQTSATNQMCLQINPASGECCLLLFGRFQGFFFVGGGEWGGGGVSLYIYVLLTTTVSPNKSPINASVRKINPGTMNRPLAKKLTAQKFRVRRTISSTSASSVGSWARPCSTGSSSRATWSSICTSTYLDGRS